MPQVVDIPDVGEVEFPDDMDDADIGRAANGLHLQSRMAAARKEGALTEAMERGITRDASWADFVLRPMAVTKENPLGTFGSVGRLLGAGINELGNVAAGAVRDIRTAPSFPPTSFPATSEALQGRDIGPSPGGPVGRGLDAAGRAVPVVGASMALAAAGVPAPVAFGVPPASSTLAATGDTPQAIQAGLIGAAIPGVAQAAREGAAIALGRAVNAGVLSAGANTTQKIAEALTAQGAIQVFMEGMNLPAYVAMTPDERRDALIENLVANSAFLLMDVPGVMRKSQASATKDKYGPAVKAGEIMEQLVNDPDAVEALRLAADDYALQATDPRRAQVQAEPAPQLAIGNRQSAIEPSRPAPAISEPTPSAEAPVNAPPAPAAEIPILVGRKITVSKQLTTTSEAHDRDITLESVTEGKSRSGKRTLEFTWDDGQGVVVQVEFGIGEKPLTLEEAYKTAVDRRKGRPVQEPTSPAASETTTAIDPRAVPVVELPVSALKLSKDVPNFKEAADPETGVVRGEQLAGTYERLGTAPIVVWERADGTLEVITGRHRLDLARRSGEPTIPAQVVRESAGFTKEHALTFDAEANIRDGQGSVRDYAHYFRNSRQRLTREEAAARGLLSRSKGQAGFDLGQYAADDIYALYAAEKITEAQALAIARAAPGNADAQRLGVKYAALGKSADFIGNVIKAVVAETGGRAEALDLFGRDDTALKQAEQQAKRAAEIQKEVREQISAVSGASRRPEVARKLGVDVKDPAAVTAKLDELRAELQRWENWPLHPDLVARTRGTEAKVAETLKPAVVAAPAASVSAAATRSRPRETIVFGEQSFTLAKPETIAEQQARVEREALERANREQQQEAEAKLATAKREMLEKAAAPIGGDLGSAGQGALFAEPGQGEMFKPPAPGGINTGQLGELGMGGAKPGEFAGGGSPTSIKNAQVDIERRQRGLPPAIEPLRRSFGEVWDEAMALVDRDPATQDRLIAELKANPRALTDVEDALLLQRQVDLQNQYSRQTRDLAIAYDDAQRFPNRLEAVERHKAMVQELSDKLLELYNVNKAAGTETGRGLAARKMMANEDFTLAAMELEKRAANEGRPLTDPERQQLVAAQERIADLQRRFDEYVAKAEQEKAERAAAEAVADLTRRAAPEPFYEPEVKSLAERIVNVLEREADAARARLRQKFARTSAGVDPSILYDLSVVGASHVARGVLDFARFSERMLAEFGEGVRELLPTVWAQSNSKLDRDVGRIAGVKAPQVRRAVRKQDPTEQRAGILEGLGAAAKEGRPLQEIGDYVRKLALNFIRSGISTRDALIDAVHAELVKVIPDITRRQTMDAISGYGDFKPLDRDAIKTQLRALKGEMQQVAKLEDIQARRPPLKTGIERRTPSDEERRLIQQVNEAKRRFGVVSTDPTRQLKSALDSIKTRIKNQIADYQYQLSTKKKIVREKTPPPFDTETELLKARRDALKVQFNEMFPRPGVTDAHLAAMAEKALERDIASYEKRIAAKDLAPMRGETRQIRTAKLDALRARRDALRAELQALRDAARNTPEAMLSDLKARMLSRTAEYQDRLARGDFEPPRRREVHLDNEALRLKAELEIAKGRWRHGLEMDRLRNRTLPHRVLGGIREALNLPRAVLSSWDVSAVLRQGGFITLGHPLRAMKSIGPMFKALASERRAEMVNQEIHSRPNAVLYHRAKLYLAPLETARLTSMEEAFMSRLASRIPGVGASQRAFVTFLNKLRADSFDAMHRSLARRGPPLNEAELRAIGNYINVATGRGDLGKAAAAAETLATVFFAPRLVASRFQMLAGQPLYRGSGRTRRLVAREYGQFLAGLAVVYALANLAGADLEDDPRSSDFGKLRFGNTRVDPLAGLAQTSVLLSRLASGQTKSLGGEVKPIRGAVPYGEYTSAEIISRFMRSKLSPVVGSMLDVLSGRNVVGEPVTAGGVAMRSLVPLSFGEIAQVMAQEGLPKGTILGILSLFGWGLQQHDDPALRELTGAAMKRVRGGTPEEREALRQEIQQTLKEQGRN